MPNINLTIDNIIPFLPKGEIFNLQPQVSKIHEQMAKGEGAESDFIGWLHLPSNTSKNLIKKINDTARYVKENADVFICIGIGGSYLGAKAAIEFVNHTFYNQLLQTKRKTPEIYFAGQNISSDYLSDLLDIIENKDICINVISKSGTTTEPAIAFRILKDALEKRYGKDEARKRIIATTDKEKGALKKLAVQEGYETFVVPDDVGGRYSALTPVGLLPIAVAGIDIAELLEGARDFEEITNNPDIKLNLSYFYAAIRYLLYKKGKSIEVLSSFHPSLHYIGEWWKQLAGESEGKNGKGIFPASVDFTTDLHSMGQWIQDGQRIIFETFMMIEKSNREILIPFAKNDGDGLNYIAGKSLDYVNDKAYQGTALAHKDGNVPNMLITIKDRTPYSLGQIFYFFERAIAMSGYLLDVNPFNQPGVEFYKKNMFTLLGKK
ncbi:MAG: glucose-6-phosphate isomerase [Deltaproteobacteria bacterium]|nr:glucose-6-phosphate isomerase [Deltaproteobacteria bacterium]